MPGDRQRVDQKLLQPLLEAASDDTLEQLSSFGEIMVNEVVGRTACLDSKSQNVVGWTSAMLAVLIASASTSGTIIPTWQVAMIGIGGISGLVALIAGAMALRIIDFEWPSQRDWFRRDLFANPTLLRGYHLLALLSTHEVHSAVNERKAWWLRISQYGLTVAGVSLAMVLVIPVVSSWF